MPVAVIVPPVSGKYVFDETVFAAFNAVLAAIYAKFAVSEAYCAVNFIANCC